MDSCCACFRPTQRPSYKTKNKDHHRSAKLHIAPESRNLPPNQRYNKLMESTGKNMGKYDRENEAGMVTPGLALFEDFSDPNHYSRQTMMSARQQKTDLSLY